MKACVCVVQVTGLPQCQGARLRDHLADGVHIIHHVIHHVIVI
jgi:hypothetical protein